MNSLLDADLDPHHESGSGEDREISLGVATILGIFFAIALVCAGFFGFGYSLGRKSAQSASQVAAAPLPNASAAPTASKPAAGSLAGQPATAVTPTPAPPATVTVPIPPPSSTVTPADGLIAGDKIPPASTRVQPSAAASQPAISPGGAFMVQIAAVSTQDIADIELAALKKYGYNVVVRHEPQDQLLHIQIGPYATRKDAEAMRDNVQSHGFNAIVK